MRKPKKRCGFIGIKKLFHLEKLRNLELAACLTKFDNPLPWS